MSLPPSLAAGLATVAVPDAIRSAAAQHLERWLTEAPFAPYRPAIAALAEAGAWDELVDAFYRVLPFGTGGRRGLVGVGPNRVNPWTVATSVQGHVGWLRDGATGEVDPSQPIHVVIAYDVRRFGMEGGALSLLVRQRLGYVSQLTPLADGRVAALHSAEYPSRTALGTDQPYGRGPGVYLLDPEAPSAMDVLPWSGPPASLHGLHEGDLDGDGRPDLLVSVFRGDERALAVYLAGDDGYRPPLIHQGLQVIWAGQLDDDPSVELLALAGPGPSQRSVVVVGAGGAPVAATSGSVVAPAPVPARLDPGTRAVWQRAEDLVSMGLYRPGAAALERLAPTLPEALGAQALARAAHLLEADGDLDEAAAMWTRLIGRHPDAREAAAANLRAAHRLGDAAAVGGALAPAGDTTWTLVDGGTHADALTLLDPVGATPTRDGLSLSAVTEEPPLLGVQLPWNGEHLATELTLDLEHLEWGSGLVAELRGWQGPTLAVRSWGGGGLYRRVVECAGLGGAKVTLPSAEVAQSERWVVRLDWFDGEALCEITAPDGTHTFATGRVEPPPAGTLTWVLRPARHAPQAHTLARATLTSWTVTATHPQPRLNALPSAPEAPTLAHDLRIRPAQAVPRLLAAKGAAALEPFRDVHAALQHSHPHAPVTQRVYTVHAAPLLAMDPARLPSDAQRAYAEILARRGMAWLDLREIEAARADLAAADRLLDHGDPLPLPVDDPDWRLRFDVALALAAAWVNQAPETARRHARRALRMHPVPELAADQVAVHPMLRDLEGLWP